MDRRSQEYKDLKEKRAQALWEVGGWSFITVIVVLHVVVLALSRCQNILLVCGHKTGPNISGME